MMPVRLEPAALRSRVKHSTTEPLRSHSYSCINSTGVYKFRTITVEECSGLVVETVLLDLGSKGH